MQTAVDANILALFGEFPDAYGRTFNVACGKTHSINRVFTIIRESMKTKLETEFTIEAEFAPPRNGDIKDSLANLTEVNRCLGYSPAIDFDDGIDETVDWFIERSAWP